MERGETEKILGHKGSKNTLQLYVKYVGQPTTTCRFEHWYKVDREMVEEYMEKGKKSRTSCLLFGPVEQTDSM